MKDLPNLVFTKFNVKDLSVLVIILPILTRREIFTIIEWNVQQVSLRSAVQPVFYLILSHQIHSVFLIIWNTLQVIKFRQALSVCLPKNSAAARFWNISSALSWISASSGYRLQDWRPKSTERQFAPILKPVWQCGWRCCNEKSSG